MLRKVEAKISVVDMGYTTVISEYKFMATFHDFRPCAGDLIGQSGNSGSASDSTCAGPHLHYQVQIWRMIRLYILIRRIIYTAFWMIMGIKQIHVIEY